MNEIDEAFYFYTSHDEDGRAEIVIPDEFLVDEYDDDEF